MNPVRRTTFLHFYKAEMSKNRDNYSPALDVDKYITKVEAAMIGTGKIPFTFGIASLAAMTTLKIKHTKKALMEYLNGGDNYS